ncbi:LysE family translocator [Frigidibacter sp. MR17.24]|uniref:LysE family translocator n=1 Tax=Frigidibacter sp. MR17.24 TaxID=3127345 RepID=UPI0030129F03
MLIPWPELVTFLAAGMVMNLTPGPDVMFATASGLSGGPRAGIAAGLGVGLGGLWHVGLAAAGLSALVAASPGALQAIRWAGAAYLAWLAWKGWTAAPVAPAAQGQDPIQGQRGMLRAFGKGALTNVLNPKPVLFILAFLPQFTDPARGPVAVQILALGALFTLTGTLITAGYGALAGLAHRAVARRMARLGKVSAVIYAALAARLALD